MLNKLCQLKKSFIFDVTTGLNYTTMSERREFFEETENHARDEIYTHSVKAGKRTYFFDVKPLHENDFLVSITESKKRVNRDGRVFYERHKIFLYKEDFEKFVDGLSYVIDYVDSLSMNEQPEPVETDGVEESSSQFIDIDFEDLEKM